VAHAALETFLMLNGRELNAEVNESERTMLALASGTVPRDAFVAWVARHLVPPGT
jgi:death on curing protein